MPPALLPCSHATRMMIPLFRRKRRTVGSLPTDIGSMCSTPTSIHQAQAGTHGIARSSEQLMTVSVQNRRVRQRSKRGRVLLYLTMSLVFCWTATVMATVRRLRATPVMQTWANPYGLVHVVQTRFMQFQPHLVALGKARLDLMQALTLPSMKNQNNSNFLWIIRTDPDLDGGLRQNLIEALTPLSNVVLVASNQNPEGFRGAISDVTEESVLVGNLQLLKSYHAAAETHRVLETRLDADDALAIDYCDNVQKQANVRLSDDSWMVWCTDTHVEWQQISPWNSTDEAGALFGLKTSQCITAGLTWGLGTHTHRSAIGVPNNHAKLHTLVPPCNASVSSACLARVTSSNQFPMAMRGRTATSAGMERILQPHSPETQIFRKSKWRNSQPELWRVLPPLFGITARDLRRVRSSIQANLYNIVKDGLDGQCTKGHSCKERSKQVLKELLAETTRDSTND